MLQGFVRDVRAVTVPVSAVLLFAFAAVIAVTVIGVTTGFAADQRADAVESSSDVVVDRVTTGVLAVDRASAATGTSMASERVALPDRVAGEEYTVTVAPDPGSDVVRITVDVPGSDVTVERVVVVTATPVGEVTVSGGDVVIEFDADAESSSIRVSSA